MLAPDSLLHQALTLAQKNRGFCAPNPAVGAVVVKNQQIVGSGYHQGAGRPHAEVEALASISQEQSQNASIYVTLEPCCHYGRTPPCTELLISRGISKVYYGFKDPNPLVAGKSEAILKAAGIECIHSPLPEIDAFYESYSYWVENRRPFVTLKLAMSLDGKIAGPQGTRISITGLEAQQFTHECRKKSDAILTTSQTVLHDDPLMNVRLVNESYKKPVYILDTQLQIPREAKLFGSTQSLTLFHNPAVDPEKKKDVELLGARCVPIPSQNGKLDLKAVLEKIGQDGVHDLWVEAGGTCFDAFMSQKLAQRALIYVAAKWLGEKATSAFKRNIPLDSYTLNWKPLGRDALCELRF